MPCTDWPEPKHLQLGRYAVQLFSNELIRMPKNCGGSDIDEYWFLFFAKDIKKVIGGITVIILFIVVMLLLIKSGHWRNWKAYYPTILLLMVGDVTFNFITYNHPLWHYKSTLIPSHTIIDLLHVILSFPCVAMLFLGYMPNGFWRRAAYIVLASAIYASIEYIMYVVGKFEYHNGWNTLYSFFFDIGLYSIVMIHYKRPLIAWLCILAITPLFLLIIQFPLEKLMG